MPIKSSAPEFRQDPVTGDWVIIAANRASRPLDFEPISGFTKNERRCPFCAGNEADTPTEVARQVASDSDSDWSVRVVPNLYEALQPKTEVEAASQFSPASLRNQQPAWGHHEVIIESPNHVRSLTQVSVANVAQVLFAYRHRYQELGTDSRVRFVMVFKNSGERAGISLEHIHSQLVAFPFVPPSIQAELSGSKRWLQDHGTCVFCAMIQDEQEQQQRVIVETEHFIALCPFASRFAFETWILPKDHVSRFDKCSDQRLQDLACLYQDVLKRLEISVPNVAYNCVFHSSPFDSIRHDYYHWHIEVIPRIATLAGLEIGSGVQLNIAKPENSAFVLRKAGGMANLRRLFRLEKVDSCGRL